MKYKNGNVDSSVKETVFSKSVLRNFVYVTDLADHLLLIQLCCVKYNQTIYISLLC